MKSIIIALIFITLGLIGCNSKQPTGPAKNAEYIVISGGVTTVYYK